MIKRPKTFAEESIKKGASYYDYENNVNVIPRYMHLHSAKQVSMLVKGKLEGENIQKYSSLSTSIIQKNVLSRCSNQVSSPLFSQI